MRSYFKVTQYSEISYAQYRAEGFKTRIAREAFYFFDDDSPVSTAGAYATAKALADSCGKGTRLSVWRAPCIAVEAHLVGVSSAPQPVESACLN